jgi:hypothetical protein
MFRDLRSRRMALFSMLGLLAVIFSFQNCAPRPLEQGESASSYNGSISGDSQFRLPASFNETLNTGVTCTVAVSAANVAIGRPYTYTISATGVVPPGFRVYAYGSKNGIADASEVIPEFFTSLSQSYINPDLGIIGGTYLRYFQIRDALGRALCQTNSVQTVLEGRICTLSTSTTQLRVGGVASLTIGYGAGTIAPTVDRMEWQGSNNGQPIAPLPYDGSSNTSYTRQMQNTDVGMEYIRRIVVKNANGTTYCQTNNIRIRVSQ